jgi:hypothetical protein
MRFSPSPGNGEKRTGATSAVDHPVAVTLADQSGTVVCEGLLP